MKRRQPAGHPRKILALTLARRWIRYRLIIPIFRSPHSATYTARGVANGVFWGFTPLVGFQTLGILAVWFTSRRVFRRDSSLVQAFLWVWVNNPITIVPMYYAFYVTGLWLVGDADSAQEYDAFGAMLSAEQGSWMDRAGIIVRTVGQPLLIGCIPYAALASVLSYRWAGRVVRRRRERLRRRRTEYETFRTSETSG